MNTSQVGSRVNHGKRLIGGRASSQLCNVDWPVFFECLHLHLMRYKTTFVCYNSSQTSVTVGWAQVHPSHPHTRQRRIKWSLKS